MRRPLQLTLCLTHDCTLRCRYCYAGRKYAHAMSRETAERGMDIGLAEAARTGRGVDLSFFGGEPLMEWELLQHCFGYLKQRGAAQGVRVRFGLTTNGTLLTRDRLEWLAERDFLVGLSIDGSPAMHNQNRCYADGRGSHAEVAAALELIQQFPSLRCKIICVVNPANHHLLVEGMQWLHTHHHGNIGLNFDFWSEWSDAQFESLHAQLEQLQQIMLESYRSGHPMRVANFEDKIRNALLPPGKSCAQCRIGEQELAISVDGNFFPCSRLVGEGDSPELTFGHVNTGINRSKQNLLIARRGNATPECKVCALRHRCMNSCGCSNYAGSGYFNRVSPFLCNLEQTLILLTDHLVEQLYQERNESFIRLFSLPSR